MNNDCEKFFINIYYLFKNATLRWQLFKKQAAFLSIKNLKYKRTSGTRWVEHQEANLNSHNHNLPILIGFFNQQISAPHNSSILKVKDTLVGHKKDATNLDYLIFNGAKEDILATLKPLSKSFQDNLLLLPSLLTNTSRALRTMKKFDKLLREEGQEVLRKKEVFPSLSKLLDNLSPADPDIIPERQTRNEAANTGNEFMEFHTYLMSGNIDTSLERVAQEVSTIVSELKVTLNDRLSRFDANPVLKSMAMFLDTKGYEVFEFEDIYSHVKVLSDHFLNLIQANGCDVTKLRAETDILYEHVVKFFLKKKPIDVWPHLFSVAKSLGIENVIHIAEIALVLPTSNAESERCFSFLWRNFSKERQSLKNLSLEHILRLRSDQNYSSERYEHALELFLSKHPNGEIRKHPRRPDGHKYPKGRKSAKADKTSFADAINILVDSSDEEEVPNLSDISSDEWTDSECED